MYEDATAGHRSIMEYYALRPRLRLRLRLRYPHHHHHHHQQLLLLLLLWKKKRPRTDQSSPSTTGPAANSAKHSVTNPIYLLNL
eukprot:COSAG05_NODE_2817_length_2609_cov_2.411952_4_plen_84_part_00